MLEMATGVNKGSHVQGRAESLMLEVLFLPSVGLSLHMHVSASPSPELWIYEGVGNSWKRANLPYLVPTLCKPRAGLSLFLPWLYVVESVLKIHQLLFVLEKHGSSLRINISNSTWPV